MALYSSLREAEHDRRAEAFIRALDDEIWDAYQKEAITLRGGCRLVAERIRAAKLGLPQPVLVRTWRSQPYQLPQSSALEETQTWLEQHRDYEQAQADKAAGKQDWEDYRWGVLYEVENRPMSHCERAEVGTGSRKQWQPKLWAWEDWLEDQQSQRTQRELLAQQEADLASIRRVAQFLEDQDADEEPEPDTEADEDQQEELEQDDQLGRSGLPSGAVVTRFQAQTLLVR